MLLLLLNFRDILEKTPSKLWFHSGKQDVSKEGERPLPLVFVATVFCLLVSNRSTNIAESHHILKPSLTICCRVPYKNPNVPEISETLFHQSFLTILLYSVRKLQQLWKALVSPPIIK
jgi:hypothetical protein